MRTTLILVLILVLTVFAVPALADTADLDSGVTVINEDVMAAPTTPTKTIKFVEALYGAQPIAPTTSGGKLVTPD